MGDTASYAPRSPDLSGATYAPRSPDLSGASYAPRSPNLSGYDAHAPQDFPLQPLAPPTSNPYLSVPPIQTTFGHDSPAHAGAKRARRSFNDDPTFEPSPKATGRGRRPKKMKVEEEEDEPDTGKPAPGVMEGIEVKTKFPVAKIKRIMQHDDEVGKVAQVTPTAVSKALELFMISIVTKAANVARDKQSKKVTVSHMKQVVNDVPEFDFLKGVTDKYADSSNKKGRAKKESEESD